VGLRADLDAEDPLPLSGIEPRSSSPRSDVILTQLPGSRPRTYRNVYIHTSNIEIHTLDNITYYMDPKVSQTDNRMWKKSYREVQFRLSRQCHIGLIRYHVKRGFKQIYKTNYTVKFQLFKERSLVINL
jgi:hypothetical protein